MNSGRRRIESCKQLLLIILVFVLITPSLHALEPWVGSKLGTTHYNKEIEAINHGREDYRHAVEDMDKNPRKDLLCVSFVKASMEFSSDVVFNINHMGQFCDWALVIYDGDASEIVATCSDVRISSRLVLCTRNADSFSSEHHTKTSIPKTVLYQTLLPVLPKYHNVFLMDEDISLKGFNFTNFMDVWKCAFTPRPLITQPLIAESNQYLMYVNEDPWTHGEWADVKASTVGYIEQQVPLFDSIFFEWFVKRVLSMTKQYSIQYGIDWGHDRSWCNAAKMYTREVLHWNASAAPCMLVTQRGTSVHHLNKMTMKIIRGNANVFRKHAFIVVQKYVDLFPTWVGMDMLAPNNPMDPLNKGKFHQVRSIDQQCLAEHK